jgi:HK97 family phage portal protein
VKLLTADGTLHDTAQASAWPLSGLNSPAPISQGWNAIKLVPELSGIVKTASYAAIYKGNPWIYACVQVLARTLARMPLKTYRLNPGGSRERVRGDVADVREVTPAEQLDQLLHRPSARMSPFTLWYRTLLDKFVYGNALWTYERDRYGRIVGLWPAPWRRVTVFPGEHVPILKFQVAGDRGVKDFHPEDVMHFGSGSDPDSPIGLSPLEPLARSIGLQDAIARQLLAFFGNAARPSGNLKLEGANKETLEYVNQLIQQLYSGPENAGKIIATSGSFEPISADPQHSAVIEILKITREEACAVYNVPPPVIGILDRAIMSNVRELREQHIRDGVGPHAAELEGDLMSQLLPAQKSWRGLFVEFDLAEQLRPDLETRAKVHQATRHMMTIDEQRKVENLPPLEIEGWSDRPWGKAGEAPLGKLPAGAPPKRDDEDEEREE